MSGFFNMDSPVMRFLSRVCDLDDLKFYVPDMLHSYCDHRSICHCALLCYSENGKG